MFLLLSIFGISNLSHALTCASSLHPENARTFLSIHRLEHDVLTHQESLRAFRIMTQIEGLRFDKFKEGCEARAYASGKVLEDRGFRMLKAFYIGDIRARRKNWIRARFTNWDWQFHVAVAGVVEKDGRQEIMIFDPSLFDRPVTEATWVSYLKKRSTGPSTIISQLEYRHEEFELFYLDRFAYTPFNRENPPTTWLHEYARWVRKSTKHKMKL